MATILNGKVTLGSTQSLWTPEPSAEPQITETQASTVKTAKLAQDNIPRPTEEPYTEPTFRTINYATGAFLTGILGGMSLTTGLTHAGIAALIALGLSPAGPLAAVVIGVALLLSACSLVIAAIRSSKNEATPEKLDEKTPRAPAQPTVTAPPPATTCFTLKGAVNGLVKTFNSEFPKEKILGIEPTDSFKEVHNKYLQLLLNYHADKHLGNELAQRAHLIIQGAWEAYQKAPDTLYEVALDTSAPSEYSSDDKGDVWEDPLADISPKVVETQENPGDDLD